MSKSMKIHLLMHYVDKSYCNKKVKLPITVSKFPMKKCINEPHLFNNGE